ncbi:hypothetical protein MKW98_032311 [Papaver atlanticum]|uniref:Uncharacterized protein n=1 Tax=Papaver atlanticum TaxID=357466 RepID=A0AAD4SG43_9MAGN|nr:hypothetical protein MKW98_032311 [Papaver atlanticum]
MGENDVTSLNVFMINDNKLVLPSREFNGSSSSKDSYPLQGKMELKHLRSCKFLSVFKPNQTTTQSMNSSQQETRISRRSLEQQRRRKRKPLEKSQQIMERDQSARNHR